MKQWKTYQISLFILLCILLNFGGQMLAKAYNLPLWLDSFGTVLCAYTGGPLCGSVVGLTSNLIYAITSQTSYIYGLTSIALGIIVGIAARKDALKDMFGTMSVSALAALASIVISVPLNILYHGGSTGNMWGDGVMNFLSEQGYPAVLCAVIGEFYVDFLDKFLTLIILFFLLRLFRLCQNRWKTFLARRQDKQNTVASKNGSKPEQAGIVQAQIKKQSGHIGMFLGLTLVLSLLAVQAEVSASELPDEDAIEYNDYVQTVFSSNNGLPCGEANDIAQTNDGIIWIGTYAGLYRHNGSEFRWMSDYESVRNVNCLYVDTEGRLWIGTNDNGLSIAINDKIVNVLDQSKGLPSNSVRSIIEASDGYYYVGTTGSMQILTLNSGMKRVNTLWEVNYADNIAADADGHVAAVTSDGRLFLLKEGQVLSSLRLTSGDDIFNCCTFDPEGYLLAGSTSDQIHIYDISSGNFRELEVLTCEGLNSLNDLYFTEKGEVFVSGDGGIGYLDTHMEFHNVNVNEFNNSIDNMLIDYQGNLWFTSSRLGLLRLSPSAFKDVYSTIGMPARVVNTITKWQGDYYFGTDSGLDIVDEACRTQIKNELTEQLQGVRIRCMYADTAEHLWICTYGQGLLEVDPDGSAHLYNSENGSFGNRARLVSELSDGTIVAAGDTGMSFIRDHEILQTIGYSDGLINSMILTVTELDDGTVLAGTDGDGIAVLEDGQVSHMLTRDDGLSSGVILRTIKDSQSGGVFLVTSNGLCYMDESGAIRSLDNFPYFNNYDVWMKDADTLFVLGSAGIYVVDRSELLADEENLAYDLLDSRKGLNSALTANSWNYYDGDGNLFLACDKGVFIADTEQYSADNHSYRMSVSTVWLDGAAHSVERSSPIQVSRGISRIELHPEIVNYTIQDPYVGYYLEGFENQWNVLPWSSLNTIIYTNLPTGEYTFHLGVFDSQGDGILEERIYSLIKEKEIYDNRWFTFYMLAVAMIAVAWFTWFIVRTQVQRTLNLQRKELEVARQQVQMGNETIMAIAKAVDAKDERTAQHSQRVSEYSVLIGRELGFSEAECENLRKAARMHDIGKIGIPDNILNKPARLTDEEYAIMKSHVVRGGEILKDFTLIDHVVEGALYHHERYDGRGYPEGLKEENIPLYGRIIGVADAFDAMTANRVYRKQMDFDYVLNEMRNGRGTQFDPQMVDILLKLIDDGKIDLNELYPQNTDDARA